MLFQGGGLLSITRDGYQSQFLRYVQL